MPIRYAMLAATLLLAAPPTADAQVYRCTDKQGRVHFSQTPPTDKDCAPMEAKAPPPVGNAGDFQDQEAYRQQRDKARADEASAKQQAEQRQAQQDARCAAAQRDALLAEAQESVARECG